MPPERSRLDARGTSCADRATAITDSLTEPERVSNATVTVDTDEGTVEYDPERTLLAGTSDAVEDAGYSAEPRSVTIDISDVMCSNSFASSVHCSPLLGTHRADADEPTGFGHGAISQHGIQTA